MGWQYTSLAPLEGVLKYSATDSLNTAELPCIESPAKPSPFLHLQTVEEGSNLKPILKLANLVEGTYNFTLCVTNSKSQRNCDTAQLRVHPGERVPPHPIIWSCLRRVSCTVVLHDCGTPSTSLTSSMLNNLMVAIQLELERSQLDNVEVTVTDLYQLGPE